MKNGDLVAGILREWISKAENDLLAATHTLTLGQKCPAGVVCFHAQQCAEKYLKALLVSRGIDVPKTHDLELLIVRLGNETRLNVSPDDVTMLTQFAIGPRYPGSGEISRATARQPWRRQGAFERR